MIDSTNPRQLADNIRKLWDKFKSISGDLLPSRSTARTGQILKLTGENKTPIWADEYSYTPPAYSTTEVNTGQKWIDGKDIYCLILTGDIGVMESSGNVSVPFVSDNNIILFDGYLEDVSKTIVSKRYSCGYHLNQTFYFYSVATTFSEGTYYIIVYYTKPDPTPGRAPEDLDRELTPPPTETGTGSIVGGPYTDLYEPEPEEKKTTRKKGRA